MDRRRVYFPWAGKSLSRGAEDAIAEHKMSAPVSEIMRDTYIDRYLVAIPLLTRLYTFEPTNGHRSSVSSFPWFLSASAFTFLVLNILAIVRR